MTFSTLIPSRGLRAGARALALLGLAGLAGCAADVDPALKPVALPTVTSPVPVKVLWRVDLGATDGAFLQPAVQENAIYAAAASGRLERIDPAEGKRVWSLDVPGGIGAGVGSDGSTVAVVGPRGELTAYDAGGKLLWQVQASTKAVSPPLVGHGVVVVRSVDQHVAAYSITDGKRRWSFQRQQPSLTLHISAPMVFGNDSVVVGMPGGRMLALALANGAPRWETGVSEPKGATEVERLADVVGLPAREGALLCASSFQGRIACFDADSGDLRWAREFSAGGAPAIGKDAVYGVDEAAGLSAFSRTSGGTIWQTKALAHRELTAPVLLSGGLLAAGDFEGHVHIFSTEEGKLVGRFDPSGGPVWNLNRSGAARLASAPQSWNGSLLVQTSAGSLYLLAAGR